MIEFNLDGKIDKIEEFNPKHLIKEILNEICANQKLNKLHYLSFIIVDNHEIHKINKEYRGIDRPTDVITFASIDDMPKGIIPEELGDIFISYEKVYSQAEDYGHSPLREFSFLVIHGVLHSLGYDHQTKEQEEEMFSIQNEILKKIKIGR